MGIRERLSGNEAVAFAMKQINPDVMGAYPISGLLQGTFRPDQHQ